MRERARLGMQANRRPGHQAQAPQASNELVSHVEAAPIREALLIRTLLNHPWLIAEEAEEIAKLNFIEPGLDRLKNALLGAAMDEKLLDTHALSTHLTQQGLDPVLALVQRAITHKGDKFAEPEADRSAVELGWQHALALHRKAEWRRELAKAEQIWREEASEDAFDRICEIQSLLQRSDGLEPGHPGSGD
ncbi:MAG: hypothetical protein ACK5JT_05315 [Hyphomicrobiaceae bacterium]